VVACLLHRPCPHVKFQCRGLPLKMGVSKMLQFSDIFFLWDKFSHILSSRMKALVLSVYSSLVIANHIGSNEKGYVGGQHCSRMLFSRGSIY